MMGDNLNILQTRDTLKDVDLAMQCFVKPQQDVSLSVTL